MDGDNHSERRPLPDDNHHPLVFEHLNLTLACQP
jgi:hypothetical protein